MHVIRTDIDIWTSHISSSEENMWLVATILESEDIESKLRP